MMPKHPSEASSADRMAWRRRPGSRGGPRSEAQKMGQEPGRAAHPGVGRAVLRAFIAGDAVGLRELLNLPPWVNTPLVANECDADQHGPGFGACFCAVRAVREQIIARIERLGRFRFADLDHEDAARAGEAWDALGIVAEQVGVDAATWERIRCGRGTDPEQEGSDGRA